MAPTTLSTRQPSVAAEVQPQSLPSLRASTSGTSMTAISTVPAKSIDFERFGSRDSSTRSSVSGMQTAAIAASIQKSPCHPLSSTRRPPTSGPAAAPPADAAPQIVIAFSSPAPDEATESRLMPQARIVEPAAPWIMRPAMIPPPLDESAISTQEATKSARPARNTFRRPSTSPSAPDVTITAAPTSMYPVTAHWSSSTEAPTSSLIVGSRIVTAEVLALTTNADTQAASRTASPALRPSAATATLIGRAWRRRSLGNSLGANDHMSDHDSRTSPTPRT